MPMISKCGECPFFNDGKPLRNFQHKALCSTMPKGMRQWRDADQDICPSMKKTTLPKMYWGMMGAPNVEGRCCAVCGSTYHLNRHHPVRRGAGELFGADGKKLRKPTIMLCGQGNTEGCHGLAHSGRLHFDFFDTWMYCLCEAPTDYLTAQNEGTWVEFRDWDI